MKENKQEFTSLLQQLTTGDGNLVDQILPLIYNEMHAIADRQLYRERVGHTLNATALIHEAYIKLIGQDKVSWQNRTHFLGVASLAMKRILINYAEARRAQKRGGNQVVATFDEQIHQREARTDDLLTLDTALGKLKDLNERQAKVIEFWFFGGLTHEEIAEVLNVSAPTVRRDWRLARAWLSNQLSETDISIPSGEE